MTDKELLTKLVPYITRLGLDAHLDRCKAVGYHQIEGKFYLYEGVYPSKRRVPCSCGLDDLLKAAGIDPDAEDDDEDSST